MKKFLPLLFWCLTPALFAQTTPQQLSGAQQREQLKESSRFKNLSFENIGPTIMSGRVVDLDVNPQDPTEFLVAYATGGLWHTTNNGTSFTPIMDQALTINIGDIAADWTNKTIWVGTGENNSSRSSYAGIGVLKSNDFGQSWSAPMLPYTQHIGRILINPTNPEHVVVAATGALYSKSEDRGIYVTNDGGATWQKTLYISDQTGFIDLAATPGDFNTLYTTSWQKDRKAWNFDGAGSESGIYKSTDGGMSWELISTPNSGFPTGDGTGRIGLAIYDNNTLYAIHDSQFRRDKEEKESASAKANSNPLTKEDFKSMSTDEFLALDNKKLNQFLKTNGFQEKYRAENVKNLIKAGDATPLDIAKYLEDANSMLFDTPVKGAELYRSDDGGATWKKTHEGQIDNVFYSYGYYFAQVRVDPSDINHVYVMGVPIIKSADGGKTFENISKENVHADHHALWINPNKRGHIINGNDGGVNISYDDGATWIKNNSPSVGQFYAIQYDLEEPYNVYGGLQDNGVWVGAHNAVENRSWHQQGHYPWTTIMGGDGMQIQVDQRNSNVVYTGFQFGNYFRINRATGKSTYIQPKHELGESPYRFNWQTPILLSSHNQDILYLGGNKLMRSMNQGDDWTALSPDLTTGGKKGNVAYGTLTTISESPFEFGYLYTGSDDGMIYKTTNSGADWKSLKGPWPANLWVSRVVASQHKKDRVYVTLNGYRWDDFTPYAYHSNDGGNSWTSISQGIPAQPVNVIIEDPKNENYLYLGTDNGTYVSTNMGNTWELLPNMPPVAVHDLKIQPQAYDLLVGTHGRSIYQASLKGMSLMGNKLAIDDIDAFTHSNYYGNKRGMWSTIKEPEIPIVLYSPQAGMIHLEVQNEKGKMLQSLSYKIDEGLNYLIYDTSVNEKGKGRLKEESPRDNGKTYLPKGLYTLHFKFNDQVIKKSLKIEE
jgi:photosystem II stability/assembly factor-like uncharacterized protein